VTLLPLRVASLHNILYCWLCPLVQVVTCKESFSRINFLIMPTATDISKKVLDIDLSDPGPIPKEACDEVMALLTTGRLHRYGEFGGTMPHVALLEKEYADYVESKYALGVNSGGCAIYLALKSLGVESGDKVLVNAFNLAPVPGAIQHAGAEAVLVEIEQDLRINMSDLEQKAESSQAKVLLLTHMRGHIANMDEISEICQRKGLLLIEDCAHTMGAKWKGKFTGTFGAAGCFSTQTFKHINSGEGGILVTNDEDVAAKAILSSGCYMLYLQHKSGPPPEIFDKYKHVTPNLSMRMSNLVACVLRPQLRQMNERGKAWNNLYANLEQRINAIEGLSVPPRDIEEEFVASSIQFQIDGLISEQIQVFVDSCTSRGVAIKWFGRDDPIGYTSQYNHWSILATTCDMRIPLSLNDDHCETIADIMTDEMAIITNSLVY
jgi:dTDP-4-amino-4,6-dideoxygalactose transaminase